MSVRRVILAGFTAVTVVSACAVSCAQPQPRTPLPRQTVVVASSSEPAKPASVAVAAPSAPAPEPRVHGRLPDGRVDISAANAWSSRPMVEPLEEAELARACALIATCASDILASWAPDDADDDPALLSALCPRVTSWFEERSIPVGPSNERWSWLARELLRPGTDCARVRAAITSRTEAIECEETGCRWNGDVAERRSVTCRGDVALITTHDQPIERDCSHAMLRCDPASPTGCTDRSSESCLSGSLDRCDGAIKLGCDRYGRVSWHDCSHRPGGRCIESPQGATCETAGYQVCRPDQATCRRGRLRLCVDGAWSEVDCAALGLGACKSSDRGAACGRPK